MAWIQVTEREPIYMSLITVSTAMAVITAAWAGLIIFSCVALVFEAANYLLDQ